jgi:hypothetical protein
MDGFDEITRGRLFKAIEVNYRNLEPFRLVNAGLVREYAGPGYGQPKDGKKDDMINLLKQAVNAYMMTLVANRPRVMISTANPTLEYFSKHFATARSRKSSSPASGESLQGLNFFGSEKA